MKLRHFVISATLLCCLFTTGLAIADPCVATYSTFEATWASGFNGQVASPGLADCVDYRILDRHLVFSSFTEQAADRWGKHDWISVYNDSNNVLNICFATTIGDLLANSCPYYKPAGITWFRDDAAQMLYLKFGDEPTKTELYVKFVRLETADNFSHTFYFGAVPEPGSLLMLGSGILASAALVRRRLTPGNRR